MSDHWPAADSPVLDQATGAAPAPTLSRRTRASYSLVFAGVSLLCLLALGALFLVTRAVPNGRVGTGPHRLLVKNRSETTLCALHIGEGRRQNALSRNKLGTSSLPHGGSFTFSGLEPTTYTIRGWTCSGREVPALLVVLDGADAVLTLEPADLGD